MDVKDWRERRIAEMAYCSALKDEVTGFDEDDLRDGVLEALRAVPHSGTRAVLGHFLLELDPEVLEEETLTFLGMVLTDMESDDGPHRYGQLPGRIFRAALEKWAVIALGTWLSTWFDEAAKWKHEYETNPENDSIGDTFGCLESANMERSSAHGDANDPGYRARVANGFNADDHPGWQSWDDVLEWIRADQTRKEHFGDWAVGHSDTYVKGWMNVFTGIEVDSYAPGEVQDQIDLDNLTYSLEDALNRPRVSIDRDWIKLGLMSKWFDVSDGYVDKDDLTSSLGGDYPHVDLFVDCSYDRIVVLVGDEDLLEEWWESFTEDWDEPEDGGLVWEAVRVWVDTKYS